MIKHTINAGPASALFKVAIFILFATLSHLAIAVTACPNNNCRGLGQAFVLSNINLMDPTQQTSGQNIFNDSAVGTCATISVVASSSKNVDNFESIAAITKTLSTGLDTDKSQNGGLSLGYAGFTLGVTGGATFSASLNSSSELKATRFDQLTVNQVVDFVRSSGNCWSAANLAPSFLSAFEALALIDATTVSEDSSWQPYRDFLNTWGSHIQIKQLQGSRVSLWESSSDTKTVTTKNLEAKVCADLGIGAAGGVGMCANYDNTARNAASSMNIKKTIYVLGGDDLTRSAVVNGYATSAGFDANALNQFMNSGTTSVQPIDFGYVPIWSLLVQVYQPLCNAAIKGQTPCQNYQRALALQAAYQGFMAYSCSKNTDNYGNPFQKMIALPPNSLGISSYACHESKSGCRSDNDCVHDTKGLFSSDVGYCAGGGCIVASLIDGTNPPLYRAAQKIVDTSKDPSLGVNASCSNAKIPACNTQWSGGAQERDIWNQSVDGPGSGNAYPAGMVPAIVHAPRAAVGSSVAPDAVPSPADASRSYTLTIQVKREKPTNKAVLREERALTTARLNESGYLTVSDTTGILKCPGTCIAQFSQGSQVNLRVNVPPHYKFIKWEGEECNQTTTHAKLCTVTMNADKTIEAYFE